MVLKLVAVEICGTRIEETPGGSEYIVPYDCRLKVLTTISALSRALQMIVSNEKTIEDLVRQFEDYEYAEYCNEHQCIRLRTIFAVL